MDKVKQILEKLCGVEASTQILDELVKYETDVRTRYESKYNEDNKKLNESFTAKLQKVKDVCVEEYDQAVADLARRVGLFLESRSEKIDSQLIKQSAIRESASEAKLNQLKSLLEGIEHDGTSKADLQAAQKQIKDLQTELGLRTESLRVVESKKKEAVKIAQESLERNRQLETMIQESKQTKTVTEPAVVKTEMNESVVPAPSLVRTPRKIEESTIAKAPATPVKSESVTAPITASVAHSTPDQIAAAMGE